MTGDLVKKSQNISEKIFKSAKYKSLSKDFINRIVADSLSRFGEKKAEDESRTLLHQIWGVYKHKPNYDKHLEKLSKVKGDRGKELEVVNEIIWEHLSTRERKVEAKIFFQKIFAITGPAKTMTDIGCGLNPLLYFYATQDDTTEYLAYDIDHEEVNFLNNSFKLLGLKNYKAETKNALTDDFSKSDIAWLLKLVSPLELQKKNATIDLINRIKSKYIIISYTTKTISGKDKRMKDFYSTKFESLAAHNNFKYTRIDFDSELVYIVEK